MTDAIQADSEGRLMSSDELGGGDAACDSLRSLLRIPALTLIGLGVLGMLVATQMGKGTSATAGLPNSTRKT